MEIRTRVAAIIIQKGKLLFVKGKGYDELWTPGGKVEPGESEEECMARELKEEIGVELVSMRFFGEYLRESPYEPQKMVGSRVYIVDIAGKIKPAHEIKKHIWVSLGDFKQKKYSFELFRKKFDQKGLIPRPLGRHSSPIVW